MKNRPAQNCTPGDFFPLILIYRLAPSTPGSASAPAPRRSPTAESDTASAFGSIPITLRRDSQANEIGPPISLERELQPALRHDRVDHLLLRVRAQHVERARSRVPDHDSVRLPPAADDPSAPAPRRRISMTSASRSTGKILGARDRAILGAVLTTRRRIGCSTDSTQCPSGCTQSDWIVHSLSNVGSYAAHAGRRWDAADTSPQRLREIVVREEALLQHATAAITLKMSSGVELPGGRKQIGVVRRELVARSPSDRVRLRLRSDVVASIEQHACTQRAHRAARDAGRGRRAVADARLRPNPDP